MKIRWMLVACMCAPTLGQWRVERAEWIGCRESYQWVNGIGWFKFRCEGNRMATVEWLGSTDDNFSNTANYRGGVLPVTTDDLLVPEDAVRAPGTNMDAFAGTKATQTLTFSVAVPSADETVFINGVAPNGDDITYTWKASASAANEVTIGGTIEISIDNLVAAMNGTGGGSGTVAHNSITAVKTSSTVLTVTSTEAGVIGNSIGTTETMANGVWGSTTLSGGVDFLFNLVFIGRGNDFNLGSSGSPFVGEATTFIHQGGGQAFWQSVGGTSGATSVNKHVIVNSNRETSSPALTVTALVNGAFDSVRVTRGYAIFSLSLKAGIDDVDVSWIISQGNDAKLDLDCPFVTLGMGGGIVNQTLEAASPTFVFQSGGSLTSVAITIIWISQGGGTHVANGNTITTMRLAGGTLDMTQTTKKKTITHLWFHEVGADFLHSDELVTVTNEYDMTGGDTP